MDATVFIYDPFFGVVGHTSGAHMVIAAMQIGRPRIVFRR